MASKIMDARRRVSWWDRSWLVLGTGGSGSAVAAMGSPRPGALESARLVAVAQALLITAALIARVSHFTH